MRYLEFLMPLSGLILLIGAAYGAVRRTKDVVEVTAWTVLGAAFLIMGADKIAPRGMPEWVDIAGLLLLLVGVALVVGNPPKRPSS